MLRCNNVQKATSQAATMIIGTQSPQMTQSQLTEVVALELNRKSDFLVKLAVLSLDLLCQLQHHRQEECLHSEQINMHI